MTKVIDFSLISQQHKTLNKRRFTLVQQRRRCAKVDQALAQQLVFA